MASAGPCAAQDGGGRRGSRPEALGHPLRPRSPGPATAAAPALRAPIRPRTARGGSSRHGEPGTRDGAGWDGVRGKGRGAGLSQSGGIVGNYQQLQAEHHHVGIIRRIEVNLSPFPLLPRRCLCQCRNTEQI